MAQNGENSAVNRKRSLGVAVSTAVASLPAAQAQEATLEEIVVTATKREVSQQDTAIAITAFSDSEITLQRFKTFNDYAGQIPGLALSERQPGANSVIMRGCAAQGLSFSDSATTSVYLDEQPITAAGYNPDPRLVDVARVEALSGPQGTLFGDAAQCGTLRIITNKPDPNQYSGWVDLTASTIADGGSGYDVSAMVNVPLVPNKVALRLVGFQADEAGWVDNVLAPTPGLTADNSHRVEDNVNSSLWTGGRAALRVDASEEWTVDLVGIYQKYELDGFGDATLNQQLFEDTSVFPEFGKREQARYTRDDWEDEWYQVALTLEGDLSFGNVVLTTAYFDRDSAYFADATAYLQVYQQRGDYFRSFNTGDPYYDTGGIYDFGGDPVANDFDGRETTNWSVEARYATPAEGRWSAIVGGFYNRREVEELFVSNVYNFTGTPGFAYINYAGYYFNGIDPKAQSNNWFSGTYDSELDQWAVFGEVSVNFTENFSITAGGRYYSIDNDYIVRNGTLVGLNGGPPNCEVDYCYAPGDLGVSDEDGFVPKVNLTYTWDDKLVYATYSEGFRRGGANSARPQSVFGPATDLFEAPARHPEHLQLGYGHQLGSGRQIRLVGQSAAPEHRRLPHDLGRHPSAGRGPAAQHIHARHRQLPAGGDQRRGSLVQLAAGRQLEHRGHHRLQRRLAVQVRHPFRRHRRGRIGAHRHHLADRAGPEGPRERHLLVPDDVDGRGTLHHGPLHPHRRVGQLAGGHRVEPLPLAGGEAGSLADHRPAVRFGSGALGGDAVRGQPHGREGPAVLQQPLCPTTPVGEPAAHLRHQVPLHVRELGPSPRRLD